MEGVLGCSWGKQILPADLWTTNRRLWDWLQGDWWVDYEGARRWSKVQSAEEDIGGSYDSNGRKSEQIDRWVVGGE